MIKNAVLHPVGDQPLLADLLMPPQATDVSLLCTNLRTIDGKRPTSINDPAALFIIPMATIRFIEAPREALESVRSAGAAARARAANGASGETGEGTQEQVPAETALVPLPGGELHGLLPDMEGGPLPDDDAEPDEDLLRRIRDA